MIDHLDHLVLTTAHEQACIDFYVDVLGMTLETFGAGRRIRGERAHCQGEICDLLIGQRASPEPEPEVLDERLEAGLIGGACWRAAREGVDRGGVRAEIPSHLERERLEPIDEDLARRLCGREPQAGRLACRQQILCQKYRLYGLF